jgi:hypothetical protein
MWGKEAPKEPGFYWMLFNSEADAPRYDLYDMIERGLETGNLTVVRLMKSRFDDRFTVCFPGNDDCPQPVEIVGGYQWWSEPICPPGGEMRPRQELVAEIARELYDRFVMGGWEPQDAYEQIEEWLARASPSPFWKGTPEGGGLRITADVSVDTVGRAEAQRAAGLRTVAKPGEPGYKEPA